MGGHCARRSLRRPWKLVLRTVAWSKPRMLCKESLGKIKFRAFPKRVGPRIPSLESIDYFATSEHHWVVEKKNCKTAMVGCCKLSLHAYGSCDEHAVYFSAIIERTCHVNHFLISDNDVISLESRFLNFRVFMHAHSLRPQTYFWSSLTREPSQFRNN